MSSTEEAAPSTKPSVDEWLPHFDVESAHQITIEAPNQTVYDATRGLYLSDSRIIRCLFRLRGLPTSALNLEGLNQLHFKPLVEEPPNRYVLGLAGQFWTPSGHLLDFDPKGLQSLDPPGFAKAIWSFEIEAVTSASGVFRTMTRVHCADEGARRSFRRYWRFIGPFSGLIRRRMLHLIKKSAERAGHE
ncbi:MAG TPA: hypothetical protein QF604_23670 [Candidatus Latescibacteria bacterium]|jgi:hypothetical protein|nr:hypothetical protein [Gemmatimonadota bacterium]MDP7362382.1 hypothetical protein [Candidatus Latescibacterota bacterium]MDP7633770.1 hypothetical protein [Candidatus Latescibacterota bacterium]HCV25254.1 hypothetical protein [Candidatus Latescibacterota bacterium]HJN30919.1 hypothetical protein [Candidatus Latescibacterota bacterium]|tara:strand:+ start:1538 stop:2104 length:567 start_codon:yes stop_codon:yes gene_type:complete